jgi:hypothetical protein
MFDNENQQEWGLLGMSQQGCNQLLNNIKWRVEGFVVGSYSYGNSKRWVQMALATHRLGFR